MESDHTHYVHTHTDQARAQAHAHGVSLNRLAFTATAHCLAGCATGEVLGMVMAEETIQMQEKEIEKLTAWVEKHAEREMKNETTGSIR
jgi:hypothetical protein